MELHELMKVSASRTVGDADFPGVLRRSAELRRQRIIGVLAATLLVIAAGVAGARGLGEAPMQLLPAEEISPSPRESFSSSEDEVAVFALQAVAEAELLDPYGLFARLRSVERTGASAVANLKLGICFRDKKRLVETCKRRERRPDLILAIQTDEAGLHVVDVDGSIPGRARQQLLAYRSGPITLRAAWAFPQVELRPAQVDVGWYDIKAFMIWLGKIPSSKIPPDCVMSVFDREGQVMDRRDFPSDMRPPRDNVERSGGIVVTSIKGQPARAEISCP